jgi:hypothetical protein
MMIIPYFRGHRKKLKKELLAAIAASPDSGKINVSR